MDIIRQLGPLAFASRLKRLGERLQREVSRVYDELDMNFHARWFPVLYALSVQGPRAVTELAEDLRLTHPAINQTASSLIKRGLLEARRDPNDERRRLLALSRSGKQLVKHLAPTWDAISAATVSLLGDSAPGLLEKLDRIEEELDRRNMYSRVTQALAPDTEADGR